jgi:hypothetical protein
MQLTSTQQSSIKSANPNIGPYSSLLYFSFLFSFFFIYILCSPYIKDTPATPGTRVFSFIRSETHEVVGPSLMVICGFWLRFWRSFGSTDGSGHAEEQVNS